VKSFAKYLGYDGTLERCAPLMPKVHTLLSIIQFVFCA
jgi:hypothetical protein